MANMWGTLKKSFTSTRNVGATKEADLFTPTKIGGIGEVKNRIAMAPMTRARASVDGIVGPQHAEYYSQRAAAGLIVTEGTFISDEGNGWWCAPHIHTEKQVAAWKPVTDAVHAAGGKIVCQLWHMGRTGHSDYHGGEPCVAPSAIAAAGDGVHVPNSWETKPFEVPRALKTEEIPRLVGEFVAAAKNAIKKAGFDGVEIHGANGYLLDEFLQSKTNHREDKYGGSVENRVRIIDEVLTAMCKVVPAGKVGIRYSPNGAYNDMGSADNIETFTAAIECAAKHKIGYIHIMDGLGFGFHNLTEQFTLKMAKEIVQKVQKKNVVTSIIGNCGYTKDQAEALVKAGDADMMAFGRPFIANPDLVRRFKENIELSDKGTYDVWYAPNSADPRKGYSDFPAAP